MSEFDEAAFSYPGLERIFHERGRLAICTCLIAYPNGLIFTELASACGLTDGNLNRHLHALAELGVITVGKKRGPTRMLTIYRITKRGQRRFLTYVHELEAVVRRVRERTQEDASKRRATA